MRACESVVVDHNANARVVVKVDDVILGLETVKVAQVGFEQDGVVVVCAESAVVDEPELVGAIGLESHVELLGDGRLGVRGDPVVRHGRGQRVVGAVVDGGVGDRRLGRGDYGGVGVLVVDCCYGFGGDAVEEVAASHEGAFAERGAHPDCVGGLAGGFDDDVASLADAEGHYVDLVGDDRDEVIGDDGHGVVVDAELLHALGTGVDQADAVGLAGLELELGDTGVGRASGVVALAGVVHLSVDQVVVAHRRRQAC